MLPARFRRGQSTAGRLRHPILRQPPLTPPTVWQHLRHLPPSPAPLPRWFKKGRCPSPLPFSPLRACREHLPSASCPPSAAGRTSAPSDSMPLPPFSPPPGELWASVIIVFLLWSHLTPLVSPVLQGPTAAVADHRHTTVDWKRHRHRSLFPPHHHRPTTVSTPPPHLAGQAPPGRHRVHHRARAHHAAPFGRNGLWARPAVLGPWAEAGPILYGDFFPIFFLLFDYISRNWYKL
jgi:hypothetical protein